jgi:conjugative relaxase-like TrwC/TraI family protein
MLRMKPLADAKKAEAYYAKSDGGYYLQADDLHREWGGLAAARLGLAGVPEFEQFARLLHGLHPLTGEQLTARLDDDRLAGWDVTASVPKGVTTAIECGDSRVRELLWDANRRAMADLEAYATTRVRKNGQEDDRATGNLAWYSVEHPETRPTEEDNMPDPDRHIHNVIGNATYDPVERQWKAVKFRPIMELRKFFDRRFDHYLSGLLAEAGYAVETKWQPDDKGGLKFYSWDIQGIPASVIEKFSRRSAEVDATEQDILAAMQEKGGQAPERLSAVSRDTLGATSRRQKRDDLTLEQCRAYWQSRLTPEEKQAIAATIRRAMEGGSRMEPRGKAAVAFALQHHGEQQSVFRWEELAATAMEHSMGGAFPDAIEREAVRQGVVRRQIDGKWMATTSELLAEEDYLVGVAAKGRGAALPVGVASGLERGTLNDGQWQAAKGLLESSNRVNVLEGPAGAGKSFMLAAHDRGMRLAGQQVVYLATTTDAAEVLAKDGFAVNTVARFLLDEKMQAAAKGCRVVVDESSMLGHKDAVRFFQLAEKLDLKPIFVGDPWQHGAVPRGSLLHILKAYAGIQPFRLDEIRRQEDPAYLAAVKDLSEGKTLEGFDAFDRMGWVREITDSIDRYRHLAADYVKALADKKTVLVVSPTHAEAGKITAEIRDQLRAAGKLGEDEREFTRLVTANASEAERGKAATYQPGDVLVFHQNAKGGLAKGDRLTVTDPATVPLSEAGKFQLYRPEAIRLAAGDKLRFTGTVKTADGEHTLKNGAVKSVAGFTKGGDFRLDNGWVVPADAGHFRHGFVDTSFGSQGKTVQRVLLGMAAASAPAMNQEQIYVSASRGKQRMTLYTDSKEDVREAIQQSSQKLAALDLRQMPKPGLAERLKKLLERRRRRASIDRMRSAWDRQDRSSPFPPREATQGERPARQPERSGGYAR